LQIGTSVRHTTTFPMRDVVADRRLLDAEQRGRLAPRRCASEHISRLVPIALRTLAVLVMGGPEGGKGEERCKSMLAKPGERTDLHP
jgi:hypothetical protein